VVRSNIKLMANDIMSPFIEGVHDGKHFTVMDRVIVFDIIERFGVKGNGTVNSFLFLQKDSFSRKRLPQCENAQGLVQDGE